MSLHFSDYIYSKIFTVFILYLAVVLEVRPSK